ncbi:hypothetical protein ACRALDRAFT_2130999 [Sodiomyces alcalophilus JCM 7366]|uniref:uncharacterized protein n=1 Tax=Sodiomyces alcalophilus JCM 7366 TaxID=591952 RepID=UPI0039B5DE7E
MVLAPPPLPTRFPCWCRAIYSWGGESKRDLGFIEGDLIECLNAGDGSWWTGKLWRDRRTVGVFPSNFVEVLPPDFRPTCRAASPLPPINSTPSVKNTPQKSRTFRKPFEAYAKAPHYTTAKQPVVFRDGPRRPRENSDSSFRTDARISPAPPRHYGYGPRAVSPAPPRHEDYGSRGISPAPRHEGYGSRGISPAPPRHEGYGSRGISPAPSRHEGYGPRDVSPAPVHHAAYGSRSPSPAPPSFNYNQPPRAISPAPPMHRHPSFDSRAPSPAPSFSYQQQTYPQLDIGSDSPPPPPPPPHRHINLSRHESNASYGNQHMSRHESDASYDNQYTGRPGSSASYAPYRPPARNPSYEDRLHGGHTPRMPSPCPPSPGGSHMTPSPLREAMDGVMEQLDALGMREESEPAQEGPLDPWSPESFDLVSQRARRKETRRPQTSMGISQQDEGYETWSGESSQDPSYQNGHREDASQRAHLSNYVERMEHRLGGAQRQDPGETPLDEPPRPPSKEQPIERPKSSAEGPPVPEKKIRSRKSAYDIGRSVMGRTFTIKTNSTTNSAGNQSSTTQSSDRSLMSGASAGGISATSAGSLARKKERAHSVLGIRDLEGTDRPETPFTGVTYHSSHASDTPRPKSQAGLQDDADPALGGLVQPKPPPKRSLFKKLFDTAKTGVATSRTSIATGSNSTKSRSSSLARSVPPGSSSLFSSGLSSATGLGSSPTKRGAAREMGLGSGVDWVQVRRDINRSNSLSRIERHERRDRCQMLDYPALNPVDEFYEGLDGDEGADGMPVREPVDFQSINLSQVDKNTRFIGNLPPTVTAAALATTYVCRPYRSDVQRLRSIFTWVAERICWEEDFEGPIDTRRVLQTKRACAEEYAVLVFEMCAAVGIHCEVVRGYLKTPGEIAEYGIMPRPNHWWNVVLVDDEWRMLDCCLASPSNPRRHLYSGASSSAADTWWFLTRPSELCWTHIPEHHEHQHMCPPQTYEVLLHLPSACSPYFRNGIEMVDYNTSLTRIEDLEMVHIKLNVPPDVEVAAEVETRAYARDQDGDLFETGDVEKKRALAQAEWFNGTKRYTIKALLPGDEGQGVLKLYAGKRGLMHSIRDIPHPMALALPIIHTGDNPPYDFVTRHPTPHAQRHDIYVVQPQCQRLALNNTFVFAIRQHPSSLPGGEGSVMTPSSNPGGVSPIPFARPGSAMSLAASSTSGSNPSTASGSGAGSRKPAKLAIQTPGGKILRLMRKEERKGIGVGGRNAREEEMSDGGTWETIIKCSERGTWRGLVLADRTARWCVFAEWTCV